MCTCVHWPPGIPCTMLSSCQHDGQALRGNAFEEESFQEVKFGSMYCKRGFGGCSGGGTGRGRESMSGGGFGGCSGGTLGEEGRAGLRSGVHTGVVAKCMKGVVEFLLEANCSLDKSLTHPSPIPHTHPYSTHQRTHTRMHTHTPLRPFVCFVSIVHRCGLLPRV